MISLYNELQPMHLSVASRQVSSYQVKFFEYSPKIYNYCFQYHYYHCSLHTTPECQATEFPFIKPKSLNSSESYSAKVNSASSFSLPLSMLIGISMPPARYSSVLIVSFGRGEFHRFSQHNLYHQQTR